MTRQNVQTQDGREASTWKVFEEDCGAVNQAKASENNDSGYSAYQRVLGRNPPQVGREDLGVMSWQQTGELTANLALDQQGRWKRAPYFAAKHYKGKLLVGRHLWFRRPFHDDDETAHGHVMEHIRDLGERLQHEDDFYHWTG